MSIIEINNKRFINCKSIIDYKDKITSIYKDKCFLLFEQIDFEYFDLSLKQPKDIKNFFVLSQIEDVMLIKNNFSQYYSFYPKSLFYASNSDVTLDKIFGKSTLYKSWVKNYFEDSCYLELTKELVFELQ